MSRPIRLFCPSSLLIPSGRPYIPKAIFFTTTTAPFHLALDILRRGSSHKLLPSPHAHTGNGAESEEHAQRNAQTPDGLHLEARGLGRTGPDPVVDFRHVGPDGVEERRGGATGGGQGCAVQVGKGFANCYGDDDDGNEDQAVAGGRGQEGEEGVVV